MESSMNEILELFEANILPSDVVYTPVEVSSAIIKYLNPAGLCLDPCKGDGAFYNYLPKDSLYCELQEGSDFLKFNQKVDWIIGNPPYSIFLEFLQHSFNLANNVSFLVPTNKVFQRQIIMDLISQWGGVKSIIIYGSGTLIGFPFGFSVGNFHFEKGYTGPTEIILGMKQVNELNQRLKIAI
jgi:hypothetical protein